jgi:SRSO17 transposase
MFKVFKPQKILRAGDIYQTKIQLAKEIIQELKAFGFQVDLVLADSLYGESHPFVQLLDELEYPLIVAIRFLHGVLMPCEQRVRTNRWKAFDRIFSNGKSAHSPSTRNPFWVTS